MITDATTYARDALQIAADTATERTALANPPYNVCAHVYPEMGDRAYQITYCRGDDSELVASGPTPGAALVDFARELTGEVSRAQAREMGREHGAAAPCIPADPEQARSDRAACRDLRGASQEALDAYLDGHLQGQAE